MKIIVTAGARGADIDVFACAIAYAELLGLDGEEAIPVIVGRLTSSVTPSILSWNAEYSTSYQPDGSEQFVIVDMSDPEHLPSFIDKKRISEVYDHRRGYEQYWESLGTGKHIEMVGSCGTLIWEQFRKRGQDENISTTSAKLLLASIVSNNLAFRSPLVTERDKIAYADLSKITGLEDAWTRGYFKEQDEILFKDFEKYVRADIKTFSTPNGEFVIGQIEMWDADKLLPEYAQEIAHIMAEFNPRPWIVNILNISRGFNYVFSRSEQGKEIVAQKFGFIFNGDTATTVKLLMRKYLMKTLLDK